MLSKVIVKTVAVTSRGLGTLFVMAYMLISVSV